MSVVFEELEEHPKTLLFAITPFGRWPTQRSNATPSQKKGVPSFYLRINCITLIDTTSYYFILKIQGKKKIRFKLYLWGWASWTWSPCIGGGLSRDCMRRAPGAPCPSASSYLLCLGPGRARDTAEVAPDEEAGRCARGLLRSTLLMLRGAAASTMLPDVPIHPGRKHVIQRNSRSTYHQESDFLQIL